MFNTLTEYILIFCVHIRLFTPELCGKQKKFQILIVRYEIFLKLALAWKFNLYSRPLNPVLKTSNRFI